MPEYEIKGKLKRDIDEIERKFQKQQKKLKQKCKSKKKKKWL